LLPGHFFGLLMSLQDIHIRSLTKATALSGFSVKDAIPPIDVVKVLNDAGISFILVGAYGLGGWLQKPRATEDVDVLVAAKHHKKALKALLTAFPDLEADDLPVVTRLRDRQTHTVAIDVMKPNQQLFRAAFKHTHTLRAGGQVYRVPSLEMALAMKFAPMVSVHRADADKFQDAHDFIYMVQSNPEIDLKKLATLGDLVYPEGGKEIIEKVRQVRAGEKLKL
jgi:hypothetical protein